MTTTTFSQQAQELLTAAKVAILPILFKGEFNQNVNYRNCRVRVKNDDFATIWVSWGNYNCELKDLPLTALGTVVDNIIRSQD